MRILLAIDGSPSSDAAVDEVCRRPWPPGSEIRLVTVRTSVELTQLREITHQPMSYDDILEQTGWEAASFLDDAATKLEQRAPDLRVIPVILEGRTKDVILDESESWGADLIVVGSHGYGAIRRFFLGSVSLAIALHATCSVEIVRRTLNSPVEK
jgi:nucleotide-binding universal stress UspA family protein